VKRRTRTILRSIPVAAAIVCVYLSGHSDEGSFWRKPSGNRLFLLAVAVLAAQPIIVGAQQHFLHKRLEFERMVSDTLRATLSQVVRQANLNWEQVGVNAFIVRREWPRLWRQRLVRVARQRFVSTPPRSGTIWRRGKGVIGQCWEQGRDVVTDLRVLWKPYVGNSQAAWDAAPPDVRMGLTFHEFHRVNQYDAVLATPIQDESGFMGCVSIDAPGAAGFRALKSHAVRVTAQDAAQTIANLVAAAGGR
jgi:hypothetical protein